MTKINGMEITDEYDVYTVIAEFADEPLSVVCESREDALTVQRQIGGKITVATHYVTESRETRLEMADVQ